MRVLPEWPMTADTFARLNFTSDLVFFLCIFLFYVTQVTFKVKVK